METLGYWIHCIANKHLWLGKTTYLILDGTRVDTQQVSLVTGVVVLPQICHSATLEQWNAYRSNRQLVRTRGYLRYTHRAAEFYPDVPGNKDIVRDMCFHECAIEVDKKIRTLSAWVVQDCECIRYQWMNTSGVRSSFRLKPCLVENTWQIMAEHQQIDLQNVSLGIILKGRDEQDIY